MSIVSVILPGRKRSPIGEERRFGGPDPLSGKQWARMAAVIGAGALLAGLIFLYLWQGSAIALLKAERARLTLTVDELVRERDWLAYQVAQAYNEDVLAERARALGMGPFDSSHTHYMVIDDGGPSD